MWKFWIDLTAFEQACWVVHDGVAVWWMNILGIGSVRLVISFGGRAPHCARVTIRGQLSVTTTFSIALPLQYGKGTGKKFLKAMS